MHATAANLVAKQRDVIQSLNGKYPHHYKELKSMQEMSDLGFFATAKKVVYNVMTHDLYVFDGKYTDDIISCQRAQLVRVNFHLRSWDGAYYAIVFADDVEDVMRNKKLPKAACYHFLYRRGEALQAVRIDNCSENDVLMGGNRPFRAI